MNRHLSEDRLIELCLAASVATADDSHLSACPNCAARRSALAKLLTEISAAAAAEADAVFPEDRLARQRARILQRLQHEVPFGRVIPFPAASATAQVLLRVRAARWVAAAAAAGLVIGLLAGRLVHHLPASQPPAAGVVVSKEADTPVELRAVSATLSDDELLSQIELAVDSTGPAALRPLDQLTPRAWEVR
jgi:anti-sigma factor RsiW